MLSIIIINYKNEEKTILFVKEELMKIKIPHIIIIVNNSATDKSNQLLTQELNCETIVDIKLKIDFNKQIYIISHIDNLGYARGNNLGAEFAKTHFDITYILFTNNDIHFFNSDVVDLLITKLDSLNNEIALIGPRVLGLDGKNQSPEPYITFWNRHIWMYWIAPFLSLKQKQELFKLDYSDKATEGVHFKISGSFFLIRSKDYFSCGMMDPNTFLYGEELILSARLKQIGKYCYYYPQVSIIHEHSQTISIHLNNFERQKLLFESECYFYRTYQNISCFSILLGQCSLKLYFYLKKYFK